MHTHHEKAHGREFYEARSMAGELISVGHLTADGQARENRRLDTPVFCLAVFACLVTVLMCVVKSFPDFNGYPCYQFGSRKRKANNFSLRLSFLNGFNRRWWCYFNTRRSGRRHIMSALKSKRSSIASNPSFHYGNR